MNDKHPRSRPRLNTHPNRAKALSCLSRKRNAAAAAPDTTQEAAVSNSKRLNEWARPLFGEHDRRLSSPLFRLWSQRAHVDQLESIATAAGCRLPNAGRNARALDEGHLVKGARSLLLIDAATLAQETGLSHRKLWSMRRLGIGPEWIRLTWGHLHPTATSVCRSQFSTSISL